MPRLMRLLITRVTPTDNIDFVKKDGNDNIQNTTPCKSAATTYYFLCKRLSSSPLASVTDIGVSGMRKV